MELNHLFLFTAVASSLLVVWRSFRVRNAHVRLSATIVLATSALAWLLVRPVAGWIALGAWCGLLLVPAWRRHRIRTGYDPLSGRRERPLTLSPVVLIFILINVGAFVAELLLGGPTNPGTLQRLGWLDTDWVLFGHQYWRMLTALFLHYGALHLAVNMFALLILGPPLERQIGSVAFGSAYLISGIGSSIVVVLLAKWRSLNAVQLVGASGSVMGIVGTWAGFLLRNRHAPLAAQRLRNVVMIVLLQIAFDLFTPRVSMSAHLGGFAAGLLFALILPWPRRG